MALLLSDTAETSSSRWPLHDRDEMYSIENTRYEEGNEAMALN